MMRDRNQVVLPFNIEKSIPENDPVFRLVEICEKLDYSRLEKEYVRAWRKVNPATLFIKGIAISEIEMDMLIEACVAEFNLAFLQKAKEERMEAKENGNVSETR